MNQEERSASTEFISLPAKALVVARIAIAISVIGALLVLGADVFLLLFAGILVAVFFRSISHWIARHTPLTDGWSLGLTVILFLTILAGSGYLLAPSIGHQIDKLSEALPESYARLKSHLSQFEWGKRLTQATGNPDTLLSGGTNVVGKATGLVSGTFNWFANIFIIFFTGLYLASEPKTYRQGFVRLFPVRRRKRIEDVLLKAGHTLQWWLLGKLVSMALIGAFTAFGLWALGIPLAPTLAIIAALLTFIPNIGPILAAVPAILLGFMESPTKALYIILLYSGIQAIESYLITPLIQRRTVSLPPALTLFAQILLGVIFGVLGVALATPLTAAMLVFVRELYVRDSLESSPPIVALPVKYSTP